MEHINKKGCIEEDSRGHFTVSLSPLPQVWPSQCGERHPPPGGRRVTWAPIFPVDPSTSLAPMAPGSRWAPADPSTRLVPVDPNTKPVDLLTQARDLPAYRFHQMAPAEFLWGLTGEKLFLLKPVSKDWKSCLLLPVHRHQHKSTRIMDNQGNMSSPKEKKASITDSKKMEIYKPPDKEFRRILKEIQWNIRRHRQLN